jgi:hypothetical protein
MIEFKLTDKFLNEMRVNKPKSLTYGISPEIISKIKDYVVLRVIDTFESDGIDLDYLIEQYDVLKSFIIDQMIFNNHEIFKDGEEILLSYNNEDLIDEENIKEYLEINPNLKNYLYKLITKFYEENVDIDCLFRSALAQVKKDIIDYDDEIYTTKSVKYSVDEVINNNDCYSFYLADVIDDNDFESYLIGEFKKTDVIKEMRVNEPFKYEKAYGEIHSYDDYKQIPKLTYREPENYLIDLSKEKIIAAFTGWNVARWSKKAEQEDNNLKVVSTSAITNPPPYMDTPHIDRNNPDSWEPRSVAMSLIRKYAPLVEMRVNEPKKFYPGEKVSLGNETLTLSKDYNRYYTEKDGIPWYLIDDDKTGQRFWARENLIKKLKPIKKENMHKQTFAEIFLESFNKEIKKTFSKIDKTKPLNENEEAWHGSPNYFRQFHSEGMGGGTGIQVIGWGLYFGKNPEMVKGYALSINTPHRFKTLFQGKTAEELGLEYENEVFFGLPQGLKTAKEYIEYAEDMISILEEEPDFESKEEVLDNYRKFIEIIKDLEVEQESMHYIYKVTLFPNKTPDYLNWDGPIPQYQVDKINKQAQKDNVDVNINTSMIGSKVYHTIENFYGKKSKNPPKDTSLFLLRAGIDGNTHYGGNVRIVFDDREIQIDKVYKTKEFKDLRESKRTQLNEYSEKIINQMTEKFQKEMKNTLSKDDIKEKLNRFDQIKQNLPKKIQAGLKGEAGGIIVPKKFTEPDPKTNKILNPQDILNYTWKDLETVLDAYGGKAEKSSKDFSTIQDAELIDIKGVPVVYNNNGLKIYEGSDYGGCIKLNYAFKYKGEDNKIYSYGFCIGRKEEASNQYYTYRFGRGGAFRSFYFVADSTQNADIKGNPSNRENFINWYHFFVIHAFQNGKFGVTDTVNQWGSNHEATGNDKGMSWDEVGQFMIKNGGESGKQAWEKIKNLKDVFKYVPPSEEETDQALVRDKILDFNMFKDLNRNQKRIYIANRADQPNAFNSAMFKILDPELKNLALRTGTGYKPTYNDLKDSKALSRSYAKFRFTRALDDYKQGKTSTTIVPLPFIEYLSDEEKQQYLDIFEKDSLSFEYIKKYFGEDAAKTYVNKMAKELDFLPPEAIDYISDPKLKQLYELYIKLFEPWIYEEGTNISSEDLENRNAMPTQEVNPVPIDEEQWRKLSTSERKTIINLVEKFNQNTKYSTLLFAVPFIINDKGKKYVLLPKSNKDNMYYESWVIMDAEGNVIKDNISGDSMLGNNVYLSSGMPEKQEDYNRIYNMNDLTES